MCNTYDVLFILIIVHENISFHVQIFFQLNWMIF